MLPSHRTASYVQSTAARMAADGCTVTSEDWNGAPVLTGYRSDFRLRWMAGTLHLFAFVATTEHLTATGIEQFTGAALEYAIARKGSMRGLQSGVAALACVVTLSADRDASTYAAATQRVQFAAMARPVVVDLGQGTVVAYRGTPAIGALFAGHLRNKIDKYFPAPGAAG